MARRSGVEGFLRAAIRASAAAERERQRSIRNHEAHLKLVERQQRMAEAQRVRNQKAADKAAKEQYLARRQADADDLNDEIQDRVDGLQGLLQHALSFDDEIKFDDLRPNAKFRDFKIPSELMPAKPPIRKEIKAPSWISKLIPGSAKRHAAALSKAEERHQKAVASYEQSQQQKRVKVNALLSEYEKEKAIFDAEIQRKNAEIDQFEAAYSAKDGEAVLTYCEMVLARSEYPAQGFPQEFRLAYREESAELVVEYEIPEVSLIPIECEYRYVKTRDEIDSKQRKASEIKLLYQDIVASITLRTLHELFEADQANALALVTFNGVVDTHDPANGREIRVPVISVRAAKDEFLGLKLEKVDKVTCLKNLGAQVSSRPDELQAIKPIVEFNMVDKRFIEQGDALTPLESRPNLLDLTPKDFEVLVSNLFTKMGLDTKLTRSSRDGGVDAVAFDTRPIFGGKVIIQAKRYKDTVGVSAVRDLYGTMLNEGASKGILVCTSGYGADAYNFSKDKPLELIDGGGLLYLLREHAGIEAKIVV